MSTSIKDILAPLGPHWDRIIRRPMSAKEVDDLQAQVGVSAPAPLRQYLMQVGLFQDLTRWEVSSIELYENAAEFISARKFLVKILPAGKTEFFPFGGDGAGNVFCLPSAAGVPCRIHFVDHETAKISKRIDFIAWLQSVVAKVLRGIRRRPPNDRKAWCVQFSLRTLSFAKLTKLLRSVGNLKIVDSKWSKPVKSSAGVTSTERRLELNGAMLKLSRLEFEPWDGPMLFFDMREPFTEGLENSRIRVLNALFKKNCPGYRLVDYGALDLSQIEPD